MKEARELFPPEVFRYWGQRDPIGMYEAWLQSREFSMRELEEIEQQVIDAERA